VGLKGRVASFEMVPETIKILRHHIDLNMLENCIVIEGALAENSGLPITAFLTEGKSGQSSIKHVKGEKSINVNSVKLADYLENVSEIKLMKMDLERAELGALLGAKEQLHKIKSIIFENRGADKVVQYLSERNFNVTDLDANNSIALKLEETN